MKIRIIAGYDKERRPEAIPQLILESGKVYSIVGKTGSGKTQLIDDIESQTDGDGTTGRRIECFDTPHQNTKIAHLSQNMNFIMDITVHEFIARRSGASPVDLSSVERQFLSMANQLCGESILPNQNLTGLSGGQSRAVMITDIALNTQAGIILIDEIENAGIDKIKAMNLLVHHNKLIIVITHDPLLALYGHYRIIMKNGGIRQLIQRNSYEQQLIEDLYRQHQATMQLRQQLRNGNSITANIV